MTVLVVALLHGRTKEEWYNWIADRVKNGYGYPTPSFPHAIYSQGRLMSFKARREAAERRNRENQPMNDLESDSTLPFGEGGISYHPGDSFITNDESDYDDSGDDDNDVDLSENGRPIYGDVSRRFAPAMFSLSARLDELEANTQEGEDSSDLQIEDLELNPSQQPAESADPTSDIHVSLPTGDRRVLADAANLQPGEEPSAAVVVAEA
jgi:protein phosphatase 2C family protein 2/3